MVQVSLSKLGAQARVLSGILLVPVLGLGIYLSRERRRAQTALREGEERFRRLAEATFEAIVIHDNGVILDANETFGALLGQPVSNLIGKQLLDFADQGMRADLAEKIRTAYEIPYEIVTSRPDGTIRANEIRARKILYKGRMVRVTIVRDITHRTLIAEELRQAYEKLEKRVEERTSALYEANNYLREEIAERLRVEKALEEERNILRTLIDNLPDQIYVKDGASRIVLNNAAHRRNLGVKSLEEAIGKTDFDFAFKSGEAPQYFADEQRVIQTGEPIINHEELSITADGAPEWVLTTKVPVCSSDGQRVGIVGISHDITQRGQMEIDEHEQRVLAEALRDSSAALNSTLDFEEVLDRILSNVASVVKHDVGNIMLLENGVARIVRQRGYGALGLENAAQSVRLVLADTPNLRQMAESMQPLAIADVCEYQGWVQIPALNWLRSYAGAPICREGKVIGFLNVDGGKPGVFTAVHAGRLQAFADQAAIAIQNARQYEQAWELAALEERHRLARELHDAVSQTLWSANLIAEVLPGLWERNPEKARQNVAKLARLTRSALSEMRMLLVELRPADLAGTDFGELLQRLGETMATRTGMDVKVNVEGKRDLPADVQFALYRITQEALNNAAKHAHAQQVEICLSNHPDWVDLRIQDNGTGFDLQAGSGGLGMGIMQERADQVGAQVKVTSMLGQGTEIIVMWRPDE